MSDTPSDPSKRPRRSDSRREPATIDLSATEVRAEPASDAPATVPPEHAAAAGPLAGSTHEPPQPTPDEVIPSDDSTASDPAASAERSSSLPPHRTGEPEAPRRGPGFGALLAAGIVGGLLGAGATALTETWWRPRGGGTEARLAQVEQRVAAAPNLQPVETRMAALVAETKALADQLGATRALAERAAKQAQEAVERPQPQPAATENVASAAALADLAARVDGIEKQIASRADAVAAVERQAQERAQAIAALEKEVAARAQATSSLEQRLAGVEQRAQGAAGAVQGLERRLADQDGRLAALTQRFSEGGSDAMNATLRVTLADRLQDSLREGAPVGPTLAALRRLEVKPEILQPLEPYAQSGPPSAAALAQEFAPVGERINAAARPPASDWGERIWRMLDKVVTVRAVDDPKASDVASLVGRIEDALERGAMTEAVKAWEALPEASRSLAPDWGARLRQRAAAEASARTLYADAVSALEASTR